MSSLHQEIIFLNRSTWRGGMDSPYIRTYEMKLAAVLNYSNYDFYMTFIEKMNDYFFVKNLIYYKIVHIHFLRISDSLVII